MLAPPSPVRAHRLAALGGEGLRHAGAQAARPPAEAAPPLVDLDWTLAPRRAPADSPAAAPAGLAFTPPRGSSRWSLSAWLLYRRGGGGAALAPAGELGGSQAGARLTYALRSERGRDIALSGRVYAPLGNRRAAEAAFGLDWKPAGRVPLRLLAERRQALGRDGRSAFALTAYGGVDEARIGPLRLDGYAQAGVVGVRRRDLFADGSARLVLPVGPLRLGAGAWAAAQPHASRLDAGPHADVRLGAGRAAATLAADWRFRLAGTARPGSGPAVTLSAGF